MAVNEYMIVANGTKGKKSGKPYSIGYRVYESPDGSRANINDKDKYFTDDLRPLGSRVKVEQMEV